MARDYDHSTKEEDIRIRLDLIRNDDLDQGESLQLYLKDNGSHKFNYTIAHRVEGLLYAETMEGKRKGYSFNLYR